VVRDLERDLVREVFAELDVDGGGALSCRELRRALRKLGLELTGAQAVAILKEYDADGSRSLSADEFAALVARLREPAPLPMPLPAPPPSYLPSPPTGCAAGLHGRRAGPWQQGFKGNILYKPTDTTVTRVAYNPMACLPAW
jgi:hypothetical protein